MSAPSKPATIAPESATTALYRAALGPVNTVHYLDVFARFDDAGRASPVWNGVAGFFTLNWMLFRQLWGAALVYVVCAGGLTLLTINLGRRFLQWPQSVEWGVLGALLLLSIAIPGAYGHAVLHAHTRRRMTRAVSGASTLREASAVLAKQASSKRRVWALAAINVLLVVAAVGAYLALDSRGQKTWAIDKMVGSAVATASPVKTAAVDGVIPAPTAVPATEALAPSRPPTTAAAPVLPESLPAMPPPEAAVSPPASPEPVLLPQPARPVADSAPQAHGINVGLFADRANAEKAHARLVGVGFAPILQTVERPNGPLTRVRVGPFASRAKADEAAARIRALGLDAVVFRP